MTDEGKIKRQAVVVVHGQGQQRPMGTIRDFVEVLWTSNPDVEPDPPNGDETWIVPDEKSGLHEMMRITTPPHSGRRTDFYELYYADLLADTPVRNLWRWLERLFWISPFDVPNRMRWPWLVFWTLCFLCGVLATFVVLEVPRLLRTDWWLFVQPPHRPEALLGVGLMAIALLVLVLPRFFQPNERVEPVPHWVMMVTMAAGLALIAYPQPGVLAAIALAYLVYRGFSDLLPLFGDAASYLSAQPETVRSRQALRERGLALLKALHDDPECERIVIVAHSLGTVLAYDLLQLLWHRVGPTKNNAPGTNAVAALKAVQDFVNDPSASWGKERVSEYQNLQWQAFLALSRQDARPSEDDQPARRGWKVSDFITLGSPLANASFLITEGSDDFDKMKTERVLPISPPEPRGKGQGFLFKEGRRTVTHHAAVFSTVRWTNIYDEFHPRWFWRGDVIGGAVSPAAMFGPAITDIDVTIMKDGKRLFSHNHYWVDTIAEPGGEKKADAEWAREQQTVASKAIEKKVGARRARRPVRRQDAAPQIQHLREAVGMQRN